MKSKQKENKINSMVETSIKNLSEIIDVNMVVGKPFTTIDGDCLIPITKVTFGLLSGGGEYGKKNIFNKGESLPYSAGNGSVVSVKPCGFLYKNRNNYKFIQLTESNYEKIIDKVSDFLENIKGN